MGIYIKNIEMPKSCRECRFCNGSVFFIPDCGVCAWCNVDGKVRDAYTMQDCPLIPIPEHGRLIDADELKTAFPCGESVRTECVRATIDHTPTVIPAELPKEEA